MNESWLFEVGASFELVVFEAQPRRILEVSVAFEKALKAVLSCLGNDGSETGRDGFRFSVDAFPFDCLGRH